MIGLASIGQCFLNTATFDRDCKRIPLLITSALIIGAATFTVGTARSEQLVFNDLDTIRLEAVLAEEGSVTLLFPKDDNEQLAVGQVDVVTTTRTWGKPYHARVLRNVRIVVAREYYPGVLSKVTQSELRHASLPLITSGLLAEHPYHSELLRSGQMHSDDTRWFMFFRNGIGVGFRIVLFSVIGYLFLEVVTRRRMSKQWMMQGRCSRCGYPEVNGSKCPECGHHNDLKRMWIE